ncbi:MAG: hypothetical protein CVU03_02780 [Bacteroidetes bacterium HGW-Bacteroidetes-2]|jgi:hypothetical protein|nr:MAG: hypothetical protein CVU03_02780 [Bacteroidetes bacterium HGW-Bacteroidetes-2]
MENKTGKYLKYAIGEIVLVVIGILLALQINNWNENRKMHLQEIKLLSDLQLELKKTLDEIKEGMELIKVTIEDINRIEYYIKNGLPYSTELDSSFGRIPHNYAGFFNSAAYNSLKTMGIGIIQNEKLRMEIINMYDVKFLSIPDYTIDENLIRSSVVFPYYAKHVMYSENSTYTAKPNNFNDLKNNPEFLNILRLIKRQRIRGIERFNDVLIPLNKLIENIKTDLDSKN